MLSYKVQKILLDNKYSKVRPASMTQLAAAMDISDQHLRRLIAQARPEDIDRIARGLRVDPNQLT